MKTIRYFSLLFVTTILFVSSFVLIELISFNQVKKDYQSLFFVPDDAHFLIRIEAKELAKELVSEFVRSEGFKNLKKKEKDTSALNFSSIDFSFPIYLYSFQAKDSNPKVLAFSLKDEDLFLKQFRNYPNSIGFIHDQVGFWLMGFKNEDLQDIKNKIINSKTNKWDRLLNHEKPIAFQTNLLNLQGVIQINRNKIHLSSQFEAIFTKDSISKVLRPNGFHLSICNSLTGLNLIDSSKISNPFANVFRDVRAISLNYYGIKAPYFPQFSLMIHGKSGFEISSLMNKLNFPQTIIEDNKISIAGLNYTISEPISDCFLISSKNNNFEKIQNSNEVLNIGGDFKKLINLNDAPLLKFFLLSNSTDNRIYEALQNVEDFNVTVSGSPLKKNKQYMNLNIELKKDKTIYGEILKFII